MKGVCATPTGILVLPTIPDVKHRKYFLCTVTFSLSLSCFVIYLLPYKTKIAVIDDVLTTIVRIKKKMEEETVTLEIGIF